MEFSKELVQGLILLLPGFVTAGVIRALHVGSTESDFDKVVKSLIYTFVDYAAYAPLMWVKDQFLDHRNAALLSLNLETLPPKQPLDVLVLLCVAVLVGIVVSFYLTNDGHKWILRPLGATRRTTSQNVWHDVFREVKQLYVIVNFEDGRRLFGWPFHYSDDSAQPYLFVTKAEWLSVDASGAEVRTPTGDEGIMILPSMKVTSIEFLSSAPPRQPFSSRLLRYSRIWVRRCLLRIRLARQRFLRRRRVRVTRIWVRRLWVVRYIRRLTRRARRFARRIRSYFP